MGEIGTKNPHRSETFGKLEEKSAFGTATHEHGRELVWYIVSNALKGNWTIWKEKDQPFQGHVTVILAIPGFTDLDLGNRLVNPKRIDLTGPCVEIDAKEGEENTYNWHQDDSWDCLLYTSPSPRD